MASLSARSLPVAMNVIPKGRHHLNPRTKTRTLLLARRTSSTSTPGIRVPNTAGPVSSGKHSSNGSALSVLPTRMLLRSLIINTISSHRFLLNPALAILSVLCKPGNTWFLNVERNPILRAIVKSTFYRQFCAGESPAETKEVVQGLRNLGLRGIILNYAKETVFDSKSKSQQGLGVKDREQSNAGYCPYIDEWRKGALQTVDLLGKSDFLALKLSGAGPTATSAFTAGELPSQQMLDALDDLCTKCKNHDVRLYIDAESQHFQRGITRVALEFMRKYNRDGSALVYNTYQAYLKSMPETLSAHLAAASQEGFTLGLKLVRGAYLATDDRSLFHSTKEETDHSFNTITEGALRRELWQFGADKGTAPFPSVNLLLASHNRASLLAARQLHQQRLGDGLPTVPVTFAQLHGMADEVSFSLLQLKNADGVAPEVYKCSTWGSMPECMAYMCRRAVENRDAAGRTQDEFAALKTEVGRRLKRGFGLSR